MAVCDFFFNFSLLMLALMLKYNFEDLRANSQIVTERFVFQNPV
jgi:hypothetical protein